MNVLGVLLVWYAAIVTASHSSFRCIGHEKIKRSCIFTNVLYFPSNNTFVFMEDSQISIKTFGRRAWGEQFWFDAGSDDYLVKNAFVHFPGAPYYHFQVEQHARQNMSVPYLNGTSILWLSAENAGISFGHCMIDDWYPLFMLNLNLFHDVPLRLRILYHNDALPEICARYMKSVYHVQPMLVKNLPEVVRFEKVVVGEGAMTEQRRSKSPYMILDERDYQANNFFSHGWWELRRHAFRSLSVSKAEHSFPPIVVFNNRTDTIRGAHTTTPRRVIMNMRDSMECVQRHQPTARVVAVDFVTLSLREQLRVMSTAAVFITTQGSAAFRIPFMSPGSSVVVIGHPDFPGQNRQHPFIEFVKYFPLAYVQILKYPIMQNSTDEYILDALDPGNLYDASIVVNCSKLMILVKQALSFGHPAYR
mmetsp:Transcript_18217/g.45950  ORF Transcript_18217/g.45950 Transcript_18217/m.45950 type:complete len:419 (-) Transcript_18217:306-1562(-)|eukprot:CAMPEP_0202869846 /NCGR_PEP_ID=MMETSP1391-20130828/13497_1 /ASSEMBLY_ACC=CAM_ASM_000867 /TAXON_ID=1034604 /ORGANISM="Chlamydomonas leiostraca, Strain SAG 11-49" /LENGTH=418 /DNA_ID=CAMNT_0049550233 /DNA_START=148 /DNA_END=1404 /DNA_ORIENTATION=-